MNCLKITSICIRTYARRASGVPGLNRKLKLLSNTEDANPKLEEMDHDDIAEFESDFMNIGEVYNEHERDKVYSKELLKHQIVATKYFKQPEPTFLTFVERDQIKKLHESNPEEWTVERLSESFPALPGTIKKILKSKFAPDTVERVVKYDEKVSENWKKFNSGKLLVHDALRDHLLKFKDRKISLTDRHLLAEKLIPESQSLPKPNSKVFSSIVQKYFPEPAEQSALPENAQKQLTTPQNAEASLTTLSYTKTTNQYKNNPRLTFNEFAKAKLPEITKACPEEGAALLEAYRKQIEATDDLIISRESVMNFKSKQIENDIVQNPEEEAALDWKEFAARKLPKIYKSGYTEKAIGLLDIHKKLQKEAAMNKEKQSNKNEEEAEDVVPEKSDLKRNRKPARFAQIENANLLSESAEIVSEEIVGATSMERKELSKEDVYFSKETAQPITETTNAIEITNTAQNTEIANMLKPAEGTVVEPVQQTMQNALTTFIKERINKLDILCNYAKAIKIPQNAYKPGMTYKVEDCYYDDDGEFLYRVPGLK